ncbi:MAG: hypothetical protein M1319_05750 [Chloroflexi bacterium]|nr:hypothetical protein [Chloroflexota bacterium]
MRENEDWSCRRRAKSWPYARRKDFEKSLQLEAGEWFKSKAYPVDKTYPYILEKWEQWPSNIILPEVVDYVLKEKEKAEALRKPFPLHKYIHHGLSSQAMMFNLIGPLVVRNDFSALRKALTANEIPWPGGEISARFEVEDRSVFNEDSGQPTSIDLEIRGAAGFAPLFIEAKLVEREFGVCSVFRDGDCDGCNPAQDLDSCYLHFIGRKYWSQMKDHGFLGGNLLESPICPLASYYQFFREALFAAAQGGYFVLLHDERNPAFVRGKSAGQPGLLPFLRSLSPDPLREKIGSVTIQRVFEAIRDSGRHNDWTGEFVKKYGMEI